MHWLTNQNLNYYVTNITRQNETPHGEALIMTHIFALTGSDTFLFIVPLLSALLTIYTVYLISGKIIDKDLAPYVAVIVLLNPTGLAQISNLQLNWITTLLVFLALLT
jgi:hypothetical protein